MFKQQRAGFYLLIFSFIYFYRALSTRKGKGLTEALPSLQQKLTVYFLVCLMSMQCNAFYLYQFFFFSFWYYISLCDVVFSLQLFEVVTGIAPVSHGIFYNTPSYYEFNHR